MTICVDGAPWFGIDRRHISGMKARCSQPRTRPSARRVEVTARPTGLSQNVKRRRHFWFCPGRSAHDPVTGILMAMRDAWLAGIGLRGKHERAIPAGGNPGAGFPGATLLGPMISMLGAMADLAAANRQRFDQPSAGEAAVHRRAARRIRSPTDFVLPMGHAMMIAANRSVSYWFGLAQIFESHQARLAQAVGVEATTAVRRDPSASLRPMNCVHCYVRWGTWLSGRRASCRAS